MGTIDCEFDLNIPPDVSCVKYGIDLISSIMYTKVGHPIVVPAGANQLALLGTEIARRMALADLVDEKIYIFPIKKGTMPMASPSYKTDPHRNVKAVSAVDTQMKIEWDDYRDNDEVYDYYTKTNNGVQYLGWGVAGKKLIGGKAGLIGSFTSNYGILDDASFPSRFKSDFTWAGAPVPPRISIP